jgi:hypothetical protein
MRLILLATTAAALLGCATSRLSSDLKPYVGRDIHELYALFGNPTGERELEFPGFSGHDSGASDELIQSPRD